MRNEKSRSEDRPSRIEMIDCPAPEHIVGADHTSTIVGSHLGEDVRRALLAAPEPYADTDAQRYVAERVVYDPETHCWLWARALLSDGYGSAKRDGRSGLAHRVAFEAYRGPIPEGLVTDHLCENTLCCNPFHLEPVTNTENIRRGKRSDTATHCAQGHPWATNEYRYPNGRRQCRACKRESDRRRRRGLTVPKRSDDTRCRNGHALTPDNSYVNPSGVIVCRECKRADTSRRSTARRAAALAYRAERFAALGLGLDGEPIVTGEEVTS